MYINPIAGQSLLAMAGANHTAFDGISSRVAPGATDTVAAFAHPAAWQQFALGSAAAAENSASAGSAPETEQERTQSKAAASLVDQLFEQLLANRLGLDKKKMDEIKQKMKELEAQKEQLAASRDGSSEAIALQIKKIDEQLALLREALEQLVKEALERMNGSPLSGNKEVAAKAELSGLMTAQQVRGRSQGSALNMSA